MTELIELASYTLSWWDEYDEKEYGDIFLNPETKEIIIDGNSICINFTLGGFDSFITCLLKAKTRAEEILYKDIKHE